MWTLLFAASAVTPVELDDRIRSVKNLDLEPRLYRLVEDPITFEDGPYRVTLESGVMVPVFSGRLAGEWDREEDRLLRKLRSKDRDATLPDPEQRGSRELVGFVWVDGEGEVSVEMPDRADALIFANQQVLHNGADREAMAPIARGEAPFVTRASSGLFLSADPRIDAAFLGDEDGDPFEIIVYEDPGDLSGARALLDSRLKVWNGLGFDWEALVAIDRQRIEAGHEARVLADVQTDTRYRSVSDLPSGGEDRWLGVAVDPTGYTDTRWRSRVMTAGLAPSGAPLARRISGTLFPPTDPEDPTSARLPPDAPERVLAKSEVYVQKSSSNLELDVSVVTEIRLRMNEDTAFVDLVVPRNDVVKDSFEVLSVVDGDGNALAAPEQLNRKAALVVAKEKRKDPDGEEYEVATANESRVRAVFPEPVPEGEIARITVAWKDTWPYANIACDNRPMGNSSGNQRFIPHVAGTTGGGPWTYVATVGVPTDSKLVAAISGKAASVEVRDGWRVTTTEKTRNARFPDIVVGKYHVLRDPAQKGMPAVNAHLLQAYPGQLESLAPEARRVVSYYQGWMPSFPVEEIDIVEGPGSCGGFRWVAPHGMAVIQRSRTVGQVGRTDNVRNSFPKLEQSVYSHEVAHQYWGQLAQPASLDDRWMIESFAEYFSCMYVAAAFEKPKFCEKRMAGKRARWESSDRVDARFSASLSNAFRSPWKNSAVYRYGPYVLGEMLRPYVGTEAFFQGIDVMLRDHPREGVTTERLQAYLERSSGKDLDGFFDFWIHQGMIPDLALEWSQPGRKALRLTVTTNIPFGSFPVPVQIETEDGTAQAWVHVVDGSGTVTLENPQGWTKPRVKLDPDGRTLARSRSVRQAEKKKKKKK